MKKIIALLMGLGITASALGQQQINPNVQIKALGDKWAAAVPGADMGQQIANAIALTPAGGVVNLHAFNGGTINTPLTINQSVTLDFGAGTFIMNCADQGPISGCINVAAGVSG